MYDLHVSQVLKAWQLVAGRINVISNSNVYPSLLELLVLYICHNYVTVDLLNFHTGEGIVYFNLFHLFNSFTMPADGPPF